jgi:hypothetical protein
VKISASWPRQRIAEAGTASTPHWPGKPGAPEEAKSAALIASRSSFTRSCETRDRSARPLTRGAPTFVVGTIVDASLSGLSRLNHRRRACELDFERMPLSVSRGAPGVAIEPIDAAVGHDSIAAPRGPYGRHFGSVSRRARPRVRISRSGATLARSQPQRRGDRDGPVEPAVADVSRTGC